MKHVVGLAAAAIALATLTAPAAADDLVKMTIGQRGNWDTSISSDARCGKPSSTANSSASAATGMSSSKVNRKA